jgi:maltose O-acetyltransferase
MISPFKDKHNQPLTWTEALTKIGLRFASYWCDLKTALMWWMSFFPSHTIRKIVLTLGGLRIGHKSYIHSGVRFYNPSNVSIGDGTIVGYNATLDGRDTLIIGNHVDIASDVMIYNSQHDLSDREFGPTHKAVDIGDYVFIGPRAIILPGVIIGEGAVVAAGAVVTKKVEPLTIVGGVPAKVIGQRKIEKLNYRLGRPRLFQ